MNKKISPYLLSILSAVILSLPFYKSSLCLLAWAAFVPLFFAIEDKSILQVFLLSYLAGVLFFLGTIYWLIHVTLPGLIILVFYLGLYFAVFGVFFSRSYKPTTKNLLLISSLWVILEYIRNYILTGFGWAILGYSQYGNLPIIQIADIVGVYGVSSLLMISNLTIYSLLKRRGNTQKGYLFTIILVLIVLSYGYVRLNGKFEGTRLKITVVQGNIPQKMKWDERYNEFIKERYFSLTKSAVLENPDLIIWPEAAVPESLAWPKDAQNYFSSLNTIPLLVGTVVGDRDEYYNSAILAVKNKLQRYDKLHLVPFGEYIPLKETLPFLETIAAIGDFKRGENYTIFELPKTSYRQKSKFSVLICFEDIFSNIARQFTLRGAEFLINITNDAWFGDTIEPFCHMGFSVFRAVENRRFVVRAANTGISCFIDLKGKVYSLLSDKRGKPTFVSGINTEEVILSDRKTFYTKFGDIFVLFNILFFLICICKKNLFKNYV